MKSLLFVVLCIAAAVQGRTTGVQTVGRSLAELGDIPSLVHLRLAVATSGYLDTCAGSLIDQAWVLTTANCLQNARFIWIRYGVVTVINPELVTESSAVRVNPLYNPATGANNVGLVSVNRIVQSTPNIAPVELLGRGSAVPGSTRFCGFGENQNGGAGDRLSCFDVSLSQNGDSFIIGQNDVEQTTRFDLGSPLITDGRQIGFLTSASGAGGVSTFTTSWAVVDWIQNETGLDL